eukprot:UC4_evm2s330
MANVITFSTLDIKNILRECASDPRRYCRPVRNKSGIHETDTIRYCFQGPKGCTKREIEKNYKDKFPSTNFFIDLIGMPYKDGGLGWRLWCPALALASHLERKVLSSHSPMLHFFSGKSVIELGAGLSLPGLMAAKLGASHVVLTDLLPAMLLPLRKIVEANDFESKVLVKQLDWVEDAKLSVENCSMRYDGNSYTNESYLLNQQNKMHMKGSYSVISDSEKFDIVLAADCLYERHHPLALVLTIKKRLKKVKGAMAIIAYAVRDEEVYSKESMACCFVRHAFFHNMDGIIVLAKNSSCGALTFTFGAFEEKRISLGLPVIKCGGMLLIRCWMANL